MSSSTNADFNQLYQRKQVAWLKAIPAQGYDTRHVRMDAYGSLIQWDRYGQTTAYGWEIDHELPKSTFPALANRQSNLRALHWANNRRKSNLLDLKSLRRLMEGV